MAKKRQTAQEQQQAQLKAHRQERIGPERRQYIIWSGQLRW